MKNLVKNFETFGVFLFATAMSAVLAYIFGLLAFIVAPGAGWAVGIIVFMVCMYAFGSAGD